MCEGWWWWVWCICVCVNDIYRWARTLLSVRPDLCEVGRVGYRRVIVPTEPEHRTSLTFSLIISPFAVLLAVISAHSARRTSFLCLTFCQSAIRRPPWIGSWRGLFTCLKTRQDHAQPPARWISILHRRPPMYIWMVRPDLRIPLLPIHAKIVVLFRARWVVWI